MVGKHVFWQALILTIIVFGAGILLGFALENSRYSSIEFDVAQSEINLLDEQLRSDIIGDFNVDCSLAKDSLFSFADKIYSEALRLEKYDSSSKFTQDSLNLLHKRYDLLRMKLWIESINLKERCSNLHTVVYFFDYLSEDVELRARQDYYSRLLLDLKNEHPGDVIIIPVASNLDISSVEVVMENDNLESPVIFVDESSKINDIITLEDLEKIVF